MEAFYFIYMIIALLLMPVLVKERVVPYIRCSTSSLLWAFLSSAYTFGGVCEDSRFSFPRCPADRILAEKTANIWLPDK